MASNVVNDSNHSCQSCNSKDRDIHGYNDFARCDKCALRECRGVGRGVDENVFIRVYDLLQVISQTKSTTRVNRKLGVHIVEVRVCWDKVAPLSPSKHAVFDVGVFCGQKRTNALAREFVDNDIKGNRGVTLRIEIDYKHTAFS